MYVIFFNHSTFNFSVPFLSWLLILLLLVGAIVLYYIPVRYLVMMWGVNKFSRKLFRPHSVVNNEVLDFLARVPDDEILVSEIYNIIQLVLRLILVHMHLEA